MNAVRKDKEGRNLRYLFLSAQSDWKYIIQSDLSFYKNGISLNLSLKIRGKD
jgi:hypothetical protein